MTVLDLTGGRAAGRPPPPDRGLVVVWSPPPAPATAGGLEAVLLDGFAAVIPALARQPRRIVNLVVLPDGWGDPLHHVLAASVAGWGRGLAREMARTGATVNTVVGTGHAAAEWDLATYLAGEEAGYITGQTLGQRPPAPAPPAASHEKRRDRPMALVSGGSGDLGRAICSRLEANGWRVCVGHRPGTTPPTGGGAVPLDLTDDAAIDAAAARLAGEGAPLDGLVLNAGWTDTGPCVGSSAAARAAVVRINLTGPARLVARLTEEGALAPGAVVVATGSEAGRIGEAGRAVYSGAKAGVAALMAAIDGSRLRALAMAPGPFDTTLLRGTWADAERAQRGIDRLRQLVPLRRLGRPEELAAAVAFALSPSGAALHAQTLSVGGGITMV